MNEFIAKMERAGAWILSVPIRLYRFFLSPLLPKSCRFQPSCSAYALEALRLHGPIKGTWLTLKRLARCHPIAWLGGSSGYDPVPGRATDNIHQGGPA